MLNSHSTKAHNTKEEGGGREGEEDGKRHSSSKSKSLIVRNMRLDEIPATRKWIHEDVGWNVGNEMQWKYFLGNDLEGWMVGEKTDFGIIGNLLGMIISEKIALVGMFIIKKEFRFQGFGSVLWDALLSHVGSRTLALYSVDYRIDGYKKLGFGEPTFALNIFSMLLKPVDINIDNSISQTESTNKDNNFDIISLRSNQGTKLFPEWVAYDTTVHTVPRSSYLKMCLSDKENTLVALAAISKSGQIIGYGLVVKRYLGYAMTPLYADNAHVATALLNTAIKHIPNPAGIAFELVSPAKILRMQPPKIHDKVQSTEVEEEHLNYWNNHIKLWMDANIWNNQAFSHVEIHTQLYRMYKVSSVPGDKDGPNSNNVKFEKIPHVLNHYPGKGNQSNSYDKIEYNSIDVGIIPLNKVYSVTSLEAFWI